jgi:hypothetical protein
VAASTFTLIEGERVSTLEVVQQGAGLHVSAAALEASLGWKLAAEGLCRGDTCVPVRDRERLMGESGIDLEELARLLERPLAVDRDEGVLVLGAAAGLRAKQLASLEAPDFTLPDLDGRSHSLSDQRGKKVLLVAYASW